jgi:hypothetical protein
MRRIFLLAWGCVGVLTVAVLWPMSAAPGAGGKSDPGGPDPTCAQVLDGKPGWELKQKTVPPADSEVHSGQMIEVRMSWDREDFADAPLYHALDCVTVDGRLRTGLSLDERNSPNDGEFTHHFEVPSGLMGGTEICSRGAIAGDGNGYFELNPSNDACFTVAEGRTPPEPSPCLPPDETPPDSPPVCNPPDETPPDSPPCAPADETPPDSPPCMPADETPPDSPPCAPADETPPIPPGACASPPPQTPPTPPADVPPPSPAVVPPRIPAVVPPPGVESPPQAAGAVDEGTGAGQELGPPVVAGAVQTPALPRTGRPQRTLALSAGLLLVFGGGALIGAVKRPVRSGTGAGRRPSP